MKQTNKLFLIILFSVFCFGFDITASTQAVFPDRSALQPMPADAHPNISGSINSNTDIQQEVKNNFIDSSVNDNKYDSSNQAVESIKNMQKYSKIILFFSISLVFIVVFFFITKRNKS